METITILKSILVAALLSGSATIATAQESAAPSCPFGHEPGYGRSLTPEQREAHRVIVQQLIAELREKEAAGMLTAEEQAWLARVEQRGGMCLTGTPRGPGHGQGQGNGKGRRQGAGQGKRLGLRDGTGPRSVDGTCPNGSAPRRGRDQ